MPQSPTLEAIATGAPLNPPFGSLPNRMHETPSAAACIGVAASSLEVDRTCKRRWRIPFVRIGRKILYREVELLAFLDRCRVEG